MFVVEKKPHSAAAESYRTLRTNIQYSSFDESLKTIVITSSIRGEGKTITAGNLALSLANDNKRVILLDCDLRNPSIHKRFMISNKEGISEVIVGKAPLESVIRNVTKNLSIITTGNIPPNPSEMLGSKYMEIVLKKLRENYDYVILDTPPILVVTDGQVLSSKVDGTILVVRAEKTKKDSIVNAKKLLDKVKANFIGAVFNGVKVKKTDSYEYYGDNDKDNRKTKRKMKVKTKLQGAMN